RLDDGAPGLESDAVLGEDVLHGDVQVGGCEVLGRGRLLESRAGQHLVAAGLQPGELAVHTLPVIDMIGSGGWEVSESLGAKAEGDSRSARSVRDNQQEVPLQMIGSECHQQASGQYQSSGEDYADGEHPLETEAA